MNKSSVQKLIEAICDDITVGTEAKPTVAENCTFQQVLLALLLQYETQHSVSELIKDAE